MISNVDSKVRDRERQKAYYQANRERILERTKAYAKTPKGRENARRAATKHQKKHNALRHGYCLKKATELRDSVLACQICGRYPGEQTIPRALEVDHDHRTGQVRGMLCSNCNLGIGNFLDSPFLLKRAAAYLDDS